MGAWIDLHCHYVGGIDDGARHIDDSIEMLSGLATLGFVHVIATPHMRPGLFDNDRAGLEHAFDATEEALAERAATPGKLPLPKRSLSCEHYFDDVVYQRLFDGSGLPYPGGRAVLLEFYEIAFPESIDRLLARLSRKGLTPVIAHPERYRAIWESPELLDRLIDAGSVALLDAAALVGKYGRQAQSTAEELLEDGMYYAACSDAHRPGDVDHLAKAMDLIRKRYGESELDQLFEIGPSQILAGTVKR